MTAIGRSTRRRVALAAGLLAVVTLTGCGAGAIKAGSAATVGDDALSEGAVSDIADEVNAVVAGTEGGQALPPDEVNLRIVALWVDMEITEALAAAEDVAVSDADVDAFLEQFDEAALAQIAAGSAIPASQLDRAARTVLLQQELALQLAPGARPEDQRQALSEAKAETAADLGVSVNPRFGSWDPTGEGDTGPGVKPRADDRLSQLAVPEEPVGPPPPPVP